MLFFLNKGQMSKKSSNRNILSQEILLQKIIHCWRVLTIIKVNIFKMLAKFRGLRLQGQGKVL